MPGWCTAAGRPTGARGERKSPRLAGEDELNLLCEQLVGFFEGDVAKAKLWFRLPDPLLGDVSPRDTIRYERYSKLQEFVTEAIVENAVAAE